MANISEQQIRDYVGGAGNDNSALTENQEMVVMNMIEQATSDPNFAAKFSALEKISVSFTDGDGAPTALPVDNEFAATLKVPVSSSILGKDEFSIVDSTLTYAASLVQPHLEHTAAELNNAATNPVKFDALEHNYLEQANFLKSVEQSGLQDASIPLLDYELANWKLDETNQIVMTEPGERFWAFTKPEVVPTDQADKAAAERQQFNPEDNASTAPQPRVNNATPSLGM